MAGPIIDGKCPENMAYIPAGKFSMGSTTGNAHEAPVRDPHISAFCIDKAEFTNGDARRLMTKFFMTQRAIVHPCGYADSYVVAIGGDRHELWSANIKLVDQTSICGLEVQSLPTPRFKPHFDGPMQPLVNVDWYQAKAFCEVQGKRLPTEAEWEKTAKGTREHPYATASGELNPREAHYGASVTVEVGQFPANDNGIYDLTGNVWEWTSDWYDKSAYQYMTVRNPLGPSDPARGRTKVIRGGSWNDSVAKYLRVTHRRYGKSSKGYADLGFRCVSNPQPEKGAEVQ